MSKSVDVHVYVEEDLGEVRIHLHRAAAAAATQGPRATDAPVLDEVEQMLTRFEAFDPGTHAREVCRQLMARGWQASTPKPRGGRAKSDAAYIRFTHRGIHGQVVLYLNTEALVSDGQAVREFVSGLPKAEVRKSAVRFRHSDDLDQAIAAADSLWRWSEGELAA